MRKPWLLGREHNGLYIIEENSKNTRFSTNRTHGLNSSNTTTNNDSITNKAKLWHLRMGHMPMQRLELLLPELKGQACKNKVFCTICPLAKQRRNTYPISTSKTMSPLELLHIDIWGPFKYVSRNNCKMFITIVDDYSRMCWIFLIRNKLDFTRIFMNFVSFIENQMSLKVKSVRTDCNNPTYR